ncbi:sulfate reduction electron transfer complex DsrMKJOP subunit DsrP [Curtanaerobium respiraculi]|uniref:sulfate reduction electron transfer complex DsrMKJOP subunit DsrP n=1 Tax=Curtanaerobium respiraculi TaxID=2949669 RepID=UPI0024B36898|nr:NrfD/PsrC family molybdoenzyme membrane anchor subunit [Curtanaerobium respiraculi]
MLERIFHGSKLYWGWVIALAVIIGLGVLAYLNQLQHGLILTGMSRDVSWGLYIGQMAFFVGVAASGIMVAIPFYLHDYKTFQPVLIFGEFMAVAAVLVAVLFVIIDLAYPARVFNMILYPTPTAIVFWDVVVLSSYLIVNLIIGWTAIQCERKGCPPPRWCHNLAIFAIPLAVSIHTVTAFLYSGTPGRSYFLTAIMAGRFLSSAFAAGPALLIIICLIMRGTKAFRVSDKAIDSLAKVVAYATIVNVFFFLCEVYTSFYSNIPGHMAPIQYLFVGLDGQNGMVPFMWEAAIFAFAGIGMLLFKKVRRNLKALPFALVMVFLACYLDKGVGLVLGGYNPNSFGDIVGYVPTLNELTIIAGVYAIGLLVLTFLYKVVVDVRARNDQEPALETADSLE